MVHYGVNIDVAKDILSDWLPWLKDHVRGMVLLPGLERAVSDTHTTGEEDTRHRGTTGFTISYTLKSRQALNKNLQNRADRMRAHGLARFGNALTASRRILTRIEHHSGEDSVD